MRNAYVMEWFRRLDETLEKAKHFAATSAELEAFLSAHLVVLLSGAYEDCIERMIFERAARTRDPEIQAYVQNACDRLFRNPNFRNIQDAIRLFSDPYADALGSRVEMSAREAIGSIVTNKNNVAHGKISVVTLRDVENYHKRSMPIFEAIEDILGLP